MKRLLPVLLVLLLGACSETVEVTIYAPTSGWEVYGVDTILVACHPVDRVGLMELLIDSAVVGVDTYPEPYLGGFVYRFGWDVTQLPEGSTHTVQARAISGSREYLSSEPVATVGYRSRLLVNDPGDILLVCRPDGKVETRFDPVSHGTPSCPRFRPGCRSVVFIMDRELYGAPVGNSEGELLASVGNGIYTCDASPVSGLVAFEAYPAATAHLFTVDSSRNQVQLTHDSDFVLIDSSRFTCIVNSNPVFSPDGSKLAYYRKSRCMVSGDPHEGEHREDVFVMNRDGSSPVNLTPGVDDAYFSSLTWTLDGKWVLFRAGTELTPDGVLAANMSGHAITGLTVSPLAMACSPTDSMLAFVGTDQDRRLCSVSLGWTDDTLFVDGAAIMLGSESFAQRKYIDWASYSRQ